MPRSNAVRRGCPSADICEPVIASSVRDFAHQVFFAASTLFDIDFPQGLVEPLLFDPLVPTSPFRVERKLHVDRVKAADSRSWLPGYRRDMKKRIGERMSILEASLSVSLGLRSFNQ